MSARAWIGIGLGILAAFLCGANARAAAEFCPALAVDVRPAAGTGESTAYRYRLRALTPRLVDATVIADTDRGWFAWSTSGVRLQRATLVAANPHRSYRFAFVAAESPDLAVTFPQAVTIRQAWVASGKTSGEPFFGWDSQGEFSCDVPDFGTVLADPTTQSVPPAGSPAPDPAPAAASPASAPFTVASCDPVFLPANVRTAKQAEFPQSTLTRIADGNGIGSAVAEIFVAVDADGNILDAWLLKGSGFADLDQAALRAARLSTYTPATSYCRRVKSVYLFQVEFQT